MSNNNTPNSETTTVYGILAGNSLIAPPRAGAIQATSGIPTNETGTHLQAILLEVANTLIAIGAWKGAA